MIERYFGTAALSSAAIALCLLVGILIVGSSGVIAAIGLLVVFSLGADGPAIGFMIGTGVLVRVVASIWLVALAIWLLAVSFNVCLALPGMLFGEWLASSLIPGSERASRTVRLVLGTGAAAIAAFSLGLVIGVWTKDLAWAIVTGLLACLIFVFVVIIDTVLELRSASCYASSPQVNPTARP